MHFIFLLGKRLYKTEKYTIHIKHYNITKIIILHTIIKLLIFNINQKYIL